MQLKTTASGSRSHDLAHLYGRGAKTKLPANATTAAKDHRMGRSQGKSVPPPSPRRRSPRRDPSQPMQPEVIAPPRGPSGILWRRCALLIATPVVFLGFLEGGLRLCGFGERTGLFIPDTRPGFVRTNPDFAHAFLPPQFDIGPLSFRMSRHKEPGRVRVFVLGESAVRGIPEPGLSFAALLRAQLQAAYPSGQFEVYNLGIVAINSHVVLQMAKEAAEYEPDLFVVYMGNNEVVGPFGPGSATHSAMVPLPLIRASIWVSGTRTGQLMARLLGRFSGVPGRALQWRGMGTFTGKTVRGDDPRLAAVYGNFRANLSDIVDVARRHSIRTVVSTVVCNLSDCPPFESLHRADLSPAELARWAAAYGEGTRRWELGDDARSMRALEEAIGIDPQFAGAHFLLGRLMERNGDSGGARAQYLESLHWDALRFRPDPRINQIIREVAARAPGPVILRDAALEMGSDPASHGPLPGRNVLWEHVHFNWEGTKRMALFLAQGSAGALFGGSPPPGVWLDGPAADAAAGYTPIARLRMLRAMKSIVAKPPFTNQLTFGEDQVRYKLDLGDAASQAGRDGAPARAIAQISAALVRDPANASLMLRLAEAEIESGHPGTALQWTDNALKLEPPYPELLVRRAHTLALLGRLGEAQAAVTEAVRLGPYHLAAYTELVDILRKTGDFETGRALIGRAIDRNPSSDYLHLTLADLLFFHGDRAHAVAACEAVLARSPDSEDALVRLVSLFENEGRKDEAFALMAKFQGSQPLNFDNNMALAREYKQRHDDARMAESLRLATLCGPAEPEVHVFLARRLLALERGDEAQVEFAIARRTAQIEGRLEMASAVSRMMEPGTAGQGPETGAPPAPTP